jgi:hypothetical protein
MARYVITTQKEVVLGCPGSNESLLHALRFAVRAWDDGCIEELKKLEKLPGRPQAYQVMSCSRVKSRGTPEFQAWFEGLWNSLPPRKKGSRES